MGVQPVGGVPEGCVWRWKDGAPGFCSESSLPLSLVLPESGLGCRGNIEALIFLALCGGSWFSISRADFIVGGKGFRLSLDCCAVIGHLLHSWV